MKKFIDYSKKIGSDFMLCQGPGGNTSYKSGEEIYIKKSGLHLSNTSEETFQRINYSEILDFYQNTKNDQEKFNEQLSIETPLHVLSSARYVFHYHSIASIICSAILERNSLNKLLEKKEILPISYIRPGLNLALEIQKRNQSKKHSSFFLYNHGMVVEGENLEEINEKIYKIEDFFSELIDYERLKKLKNNISILKQNNFKIKNPNSEIIYEKFNNKFLFPDHGVFFPYPIDRNTHSPINYDEHYLNFNKQLTETELLYFKTLLIIFTYINNGKLLNYIDKETSAELRNSEDEILRRKLNK